jgi:hypothetical protein
MEPGGPEVEAKLLPPDLLVSRCIEGRSLSLANNFEEVSRGLGRAPRAQAPMHQVDHRFTSDGKKEDGPHRAKSVRSQKPLEV